MSAPPILERLATVLRSSGFREVTGDVGRQAVDLLDVMTGKRYALVLREKPAPYGAAHRLTCPALIPGASPDDCGCGALAGRAR